jgi:hypothetical protein
MPGSTIGIHFENHEGTKLEWSGNIEIVRSGNELKVEFNPGKSDRLSDSIRAAVKAIAEKELNP